MYASSFASINADGQLSTSFRTFTDRYGCEIIAEQVDFLAKAKEATKYEPKKRRSK